MLKLHSLVFGFSCLIIVQGQNSSFTTTTFWTTRITDPTTITHDSTTPPLPTTTSFWTTGTTDPSLITHDSTTPPLRTTTTELETTNPAPQLCIDLPNLTLDFLITSQFPGTWFDTWYLTATHPTPSSPLLCLQIDFYLKRDQSLKINMTYSNKPDMPWFNRTISGIYDDEADISQAYRVRFNKGSSSFTPWVNYKILETDLLNYAFLCGYTNESDMKTSFGLLLTQKRDLSITELSDYWEMAAEKYANFPYDVMTDILQDETCYKDIYGGGNSGSSRNLHTTLALSIIILIMMVLILLVPY